MSNRKEKSEKPVWRFFRRRLEEISGLILIAAGLAPLAALAGWPPMIALANRLTALLGLAGWGLSLIALSWGWAMLRHHAPIWRAWRILTLAAAGLSGAIFLAHFPAPQSALFSEGFGGAAGYVFAEGVKDFFPTYAHFLKEFAVPGAMAAIFIFVCALPIHWRKMFLRQRRILNEDNTLSPLIKNLQKADRQADNPNMLKKIAAITQNRLAAHQGIYRKINLRKPIEKIIHGSIDCGRMIVRAIKNKLTPSNLTVPAQKKEKYSEPIPFLQRRHDMRSDMRAQPRDRPIIKKPPRKISRKLPSLSLIEAPAPRRKAGAQKNQTDALAQQLDIVLKDFNIKGEIRDIKPGPVVTLFEFKPAPGIKSSRIIGLADDIARSMSALSARIAIMPGRNALGIEIPSQNREDVHLADLVASREYKNTQYDLPLILGKTIGGDPVIADLAAMPHLLVAGTTGSGKSMAINTMILSLLYRMHMDQCRLIMIDPKMLELSVYQDIPHLLAPVVTDPKKAVAALKWIVQEMEARYRKMSEINVRSIANYNKKAARSDEHMPFIIVIIDEMADLMMVAGKDIEAAVQRLAQMARAAGIHLIAATQRPSVDVITGTIKANFPTRISFQVTSRIDSRTILGESGGEQLLGRGDMLFMMAGGKTQRVHGPFIADAQVEQVAEFLRRNGPAPDYREDITQTTSQTDSASIADSGDDDLYAQAITIVCQNSRASTSFLQRKLQIGYNRAARLIERMEDNGIISAPNHAGKRQVLRDSQG